MDGDEVLGLFLDEVDPPPGARLEAARLLDQGSTWAWPERPVHLPGLCIRPPGSSGGPGDLLLEPGTAFGSGHHPSTRLVLERLVERAPTGAVLDVGTGSGVLALLALRLGAPLAVGVDPDPEARRVAARNARLNGLQDRLRLEERLPDGLFPMILVNIVADTILALGPELVRRLGPGGELVLSGLSSGRRAEVQRAMVGLGLCPRGGEERAGWCRLELQAGW